MKLPLILCFDGETFCGKIGPMKKLQKIFFCFPTDYTLYEQRPLNEYSLTLFIISIYESMLQY